MTCYFTDHFDSYFDVCEDVEDTSTPLPEFSAFVDQVSPRFVFDIPKDDEEVLMMLLQFVAADQVH